MPNAFGFTRPGQQPTPDPRQVGQQLMQPQAPQQQTQPRPQQRPQPFDVDPVDAEFPAHSMDAAFRREGGKLMGGGGDDNDGALSAAVGEALTRAGGGHKPNPNPHKNRDGNVRQIMQLGISQLEAELLREVL